MITEITKVEIKKDQIILEGTDLEHLFTTNDLFIDIPEEPVRFVFDRQPGSIKYLYKVCSSQNKCKEAKSIGGKIESLVGCIISLSESFIQKS